MAKKKQFVKGSKEAKAFMAKLRAKRKAKVSGEKESTAIKNYLEDRNQRLTHGYHTQPDISAGARKLKAKQYKKHVLKEASKLKKQKPFKARKLSGIHKDTKSHNVKINVLSGAVCGVDKNKFINDLKDIENSIQKLQNSILKNKETAKLFPYKTAFWRAHFKKKNKEIAYMINSLKRAKNLIKKNI